MYVALADAIERDVAAGLLRRGQKLPTHRDLAEALGVTVGTVTRGYAAAEKRGLVSGVTGRGTFVTPDAATGPALPGPQHGEGRPIEMGLAMAHTSLPDLQQALAELAASSDAADLLRYSEPAGLPAHRGTAAAWLAQNSLAPSSAGAEDVVVCAGGQHALACVLMALLAPSGVLVAEPQTYPGLKTLARSLGVTLVPGAADEQGLLPAELETLSRREGASAVYLMPSLQNPTTRCMGEARRRELAVEAQRLGLWLVEDDAYALLRQDRPAALSCYAPERTVSIASVSKSLAGGLRTAFVFVPRELRPAMERAVQSSIWMAPPLMAELSLRFVASGEAQRVLQSRLRENRRRWELVCGELQGADCQGVPEGYFIWLHLPAPWSGLAFEARAREKGVNVFAAERFCIGGAAAPAAVRVATTGAENHAALRQGAQVLGELLRGDALPERAIM